MKKAIIAGLMITALAVVYAADSGQWIKMTPVSIPGSPPGVVLRTAGPLSPTPHQVPAIGLNSFMPGTPPDNQTLWTAQWITYYNGLYTYWTGVNEWCEMFIPADFGLTYPFNIDSLRFYYYYPGYYDAPVCYRVYANDMSTLLYRYPASGLTTPPAYYDYTTPYTVPVTPSLSIASGNFYVSDSSTTTSYPYLIMDGTEPSSGWKDYYRSGTSWYLLDDYGDWAIDIFVRPGAIVCDVGVTKVTAPGIYNIIPPGVDTVYTGLAYAPACSVKNFGTPNVTVPFLVNCTITATGEATFTTSANCPPLNSGLLTLLTFPTWTSYRDAGVTCTVTCSTAVNGDINASNDKKTKTVYTKGDVAAVDGIDPTDQVYVNEIYNPTGKIQNMYPGYTALFPITCQILDGSGAIIYSKTRNDTLGPNQTKPTAFDDWKVPPTVGVTYEIDLTTQMPGDFNPANNKYAWYVTSVAQTGIDVGVDSITAPTGSVKVNEVFKPKAIVHNYGTGAATFDVRCVIGPDTSTKSVVSLAKDATQEVVFDDWSSTAPGDFTIKVKTLLAGDGNPANDELVKTFTVNGIAENQPLPTAYSLNAARPNPVSTYTDISYTIPENANVSVTIYDVTGKLVKTLTVGAEAAGYKSVRWDGRDTSGKTVPNGLYFIRFETPKYSSTGKLVLTR